ncbi:DEAD-box ATP-dependent RNA helicase 32-like isoform X1 [Nymphaea colorata]|nr:DEAD-box ATP-dependent RNA helicase 32-like isoform X1 [Nymphaea colorata]XP_049934223.1 DEAD-box ATP-dependent RNA helicase 32-like isoform X1 [Nymphaea colorata]
MRKQKPRKKQGDVNEEADEIKLLELWIESGKPDSGTNPLSISGVPEVGLVGQMDNGSFSPYVGCTRFDQLPLSQRTKDSLRDKFTVMSDIQRATLPHSLCGRDVLGAAKTGSGKSLAFIIPVLEKLYRARWGPEDGVGCIILSPTRELASQLFKVLEMVGKYHGFSAGRLIGGSKSVDIEKERVNGINILVCTPGRLLQHMDETPNFDCSQLQILVLDEADRILDLTFKKDLNAIISQLPRQRQTLLFSATQTKSVQDLARLSLKDPERLSVHEESVTATPERLMQRSMIVPLDKKLDMLWSFIKSHLNAKILVFLSTCKQVKFVYEAFKKLRPGIPLKCLHGRMNQNKRMAIFFQYCEERRSVLFSTDVASRGLDFPAVEWVVQVDCPEDVAAYIHRVGRTARFSSGGRSLLFLMPSEKQVIINLQDAKIPVQMWKANNKKIQSISGALAALLVQYPELRRLAERAFITYLKSLKWQASGLEFDWNSLPILEFSISYGLPMAPKCRFLNKKLQGGENGHASETLETKIEKGDGGDREFDDILLPRNSLTEAGPNDDTYGLATRILKKKKLKINVDRPAGLKFVFDEEGNALPPLAAYANAVIEDSVIEPEKVRERYQKLREEMKVWDQEDKVLLKRRLRERRILDKMKYKKKLAREIDDEDEPANSDGEVSNHLNQLTRGSKVYFGSESSDEGEVTCDGPDNKKIKRELNAKVDTISLVEQEALALKLLNSLH